MGSIKFVLTSEECTLTNPVSCLVGSDNANVICVQV
jgi:hypothetical protein